MHHRLAGLALVCAGVLVFVSGCSFFEPRHHVKNVAVSPKMRGISVDAKSRFIWSPIIPVKTRTNTVNGGLATYELKKRQIVCAEPSPDALSQISASLRGSFDGTFKSTRISAEAQATLTEVAKALGVRTVSIQALRDGLYRACEAYINGLLDEFGYALIVAKYDNLLSQLIAIEVAGSASEADLNEEEKQKLVAADTAKSAAESASDIVRRAETLVANTDGALKTLTADKAKTDEEIAKVKAQIAVLKASTPVDEKKLGDRNVELAGLEAKSKLQTTRVDATADDLKKAKSALQDARLDLNKKLGDAATAEKTALSIRAHATKARADQLVRIIKENNGAGQHIATVAGACLMWFAKNQNIAARRSHTTAEPAIAKYCRRYVELSVRALGMRMRGVVFDKLKGTALSARLFNNIYWKPLPRAVRNRPSRHPRWRRN